MFTPKIPYLLVLVGDPAVQEAEHALSSLQDHVFPAQRPMLELICLVENPLLSLPAASGKGIQVSSFLLREVLENNGFGGLVLNTRVDINNRMPEDIRDQVYHRKMGLAFVLRGVDVPAEQVFQLHQQAQHVLKATNVQLISQLCYLTEDRPDRFTAQSLWLRDEAQPQQIRQGFHDFGHLLVLSARQAGGYQGVEVDHQQKEAFPPGLLALLNQHEQPGTTQLVTMRFGKISGSSYEIRQLLNHIAAQHLDDWAKRDIGTTDTWRFLNIPGMREAGDTSQEGLLEAIKKSLEPLMPDLADLACVGLSERDNDMQEVLLSFHQLNEAQISSQDRAAEWASQWMDQALERADAQAHLDSMVRHLQEDGAIGRVIYLAKQAAQKKSREMADGPAWFRERWRHGYDISKRHFESYPKYQLRVLGGLLADLRELWMVRGCAARLDALDHARKLLVAALEERLRRRRKLLEAYRLSPGEEAVLSRTCRKYWENCQAEIARIPVERLSGYADLEQTLYDELKLEESWQGLFEQLRQGAAAYQHTFAGAFALDLSPSNLAAKVVDYPDYNDDTLLPQLPLNAQPQFTTYHPVASSIFEALGDKQQSASFVRIPGDLVEKMTLVKLDPIEQLSQLRMFSPLDFSAPEPLQALQRKEVQEQVEQAAPLGQHNPLQAKLNKEGRLYWLYWDWQGPSDQLCSLSIPENGFSQRVSYSTWLESGQRVTLPDARIPYGRFDLLLTCGQKEWQVSLEGRGLSIHSHYSRIRKKLKLDAYEHLSALSIDLSGDVDAANDHCVLKKEKPDGCFYYDVFRFSDSGDPSILGPVYRLEGEVISLEGVGRLEGFITEQQSGEF